MIIDDKMNISAYFIYECVRVYTCVCIHYQVMIEGPNNIKRTSGDLYPDRFCLGCCSSQVHATVTCSRLSLHELPR